MPRLRFVEGWEDGLDGAVLEPTDAVVPRVPLDQVLVARPEEALRVHAAGCELLPEQLEHHVLLHSLPIGAELDVTAGAFGVPGRLEGGDCQALATVEGLHRLVGVLDRRVLDAHIAPHARSLEVAEGERDHARLLAARCAPRASSTPIKWLTLGQPPHQPLPPTTG